MPEITRLRGDATTRGAGSDAVTVYDHGEGG